MATGKSLTAPLDEFLQTYLVDKAPFQLPANAKETLVKVSPWIIIIVLVFTLPLVLFAFGLGALVAPFAFLGGPAAGADYAAGFTLAMVFLAVAVVLDIMALPGLFARSMRGWRLVYYGTIASLVYSLVSGNVLGGLINALISFYLLFQIKSYYK